jgi:rare lipoprotein A
MERCAMTVRYSHTQNKKTLWCVMKFLRGYAVIAFMLAASPVAYAENCKYMQTGIASVYSEKLNGGKTSSGEKLDMSAHTAAHPSLKSGTRVKAVDAKTGRTTYVKINDNGPHKAKRILDVTTAGASDLGFEKNKRRKSYTGLRRIKLYVCS